MVSSLFLESTRKEAVYYRIEILATDWDFSGLTVTATEIANVNDEQFLETTTKRNEKNNYYYNYVFISIVYEKTYDINY